MHLINIINVFREGKLPPMQEIPAPLLNAITTMGSLRGKFSRLSSIERVLTAIQHKEPDQVPVTPIVYAAA